MTWPQTPPTGRAEDVSSIFISGFPEDAKPREVLNLVRFLDGYVVRFAETWPCAFPSRIISQDADNECF